MSGHENSTKDCNEESKSELGFTETDRPMIEDAKSPSIEENGLLGALAKTRVVVEAFVLAFEDALAAELILVVNNDETRRSTTF